MEAKSHQDNHKGSHKSHTHNRKHIDHHNGDSQSLRVIGKGSKISTEFNHSTYAGHHKKDETGIGKKADSSRTESLDKLRKKFGFSWNRFGRKMLLGGIALGLIAIVGLSILAAWLITIWNRTPEIDSFNEPVQSSIVYDRNGDELFKFFSEERREVVDIDQIPRQTQLAIIALEDENFYYNESGIPWSNIVGATFSCFTQAGDNCRGGSGLSQQLVKNITGDDQTTISRKVRELFTAIKLNQEKNKQEILAMYLNQVPFGRNAYGIQEASKSYFGKDVSELDVVQSCYLASLPQRPSTFANSINNQDSDAFKDFEFRKNVCLEKLHTEKLEGNNIDPFIETEEELEELQNTPVAEVGFIDFVVENKFPHFRDYVTAELRKLNISEQALFTQGYKITTTIDPTIQQQVDETFENLAESALDAQGVNNGAALVLDGPTGEILAMRGSRDYNNEDIDGQVNITTSPQQPGSSIKPYVYLSAFDKGFNPATTLIDNKMDFGGGFIPKNFTDRNNGIMSIRTALQNSYNIPAVKGMYLSAGGTDTIENPDAALGQGLDNFFNIVRKMGLDFPCITVGDGAETCADPATAENAYRDRCFLSTSIGGCEVTMVSHATGTNTILQDGNLRTATPFISIIDPKTDTDIYKVNQESDNPVYAVQDAVIDPAIARQTAYVMTDWRERGVAFCGGYGVRCNLSKNLDLVDQGWDDENAIAAKTGTTDEIRDMWTVGGSPYYTVTTWAGNTDNTPAGSRNASSSLSAGGLFKDIMVKIHEGKEKTGFSREGLTPTGLDGRSGLLGSGKTELLTEKQINVLNETQEKLNSGKVNPAEASIFVNRGVIVSSKLKINKIDGLLAVEGKTLEENIEERTFVQVVPEFPVDPWKRIAEAYSANFDQPPTEFSEQDQVSDQGSKPNITVNVSENNQAPNTITASAEPTGSNDKTIKKVEIFVDGDSVASSNGKQASFKPNDSLQGSKTIRIFAQDSYGISNELTIKNVTFGGDSVTINNPDSVSLANPSITLSVTSTANLVPAPTLTIEQDGLTRSCAANTKSGDTYSCQVPTVLFQPEEATISFKDNSAQDLTAPSIVITFNL